jgi:hypothetical protein
MTVLDIWALPAAERTCFICHHVLVGQDEQGPYYQQQHAAEVPGSGRFPDEPYIGMTFTDRVYACENGARHTYPAMFRQVGPGYDRDLVVAALAASFAVKRLGRPLRLDEVTPPMCGQTALMHLRGAFAAADNGHTVVPDPPAGITSIHARWTCVFCGRAALDRDRAMIDPVYGSAVIEQCEARS